MLMSDATSFEQASGAVLAILQRLPLVPVVGVDELSESDLRFLLVTSCARIIEHMVVLTAHTDRDEAMRGLDALIVSMREHLANWKTE